VIVVVGCCLDVYAPSRPPGCRRLCPAKSLISLCLKTCLLLNCLLSTWLSILAARYYWLNFLSSTCEGCIFCCHRYLVAFRLVHAALPLHTPPCQALYTASDKPLILSTLNTDMNLGCLSDGLLGPFHRCQEFSFLVMSTNSNHSHCHKQQILCT
jgi:hypothetical protein